MYMVYQYINFIVYFIFSCCYLYQIVYIFMCFFKKDKSKQYKAEKQHRFAILIPARNEQNVICDLLESIKRQNYSKELIDVYVIADNCTDNTAKICRDFGVNVFERYNDRQIGKGYVLDFAFKLIDKEKGIDFYDGYFVFDADNVLDYEFVNEMNKVFDRGYNVVTGYRNSKNYGANWISAGYALWFLRESKYLNGARMRCNTSCTISGTGFLVSSKIIKKEGGWKHFLLTEDIEFAADQIVSGECIGYCERAVLYDEQPERFVHSWKQRKRWAKGFYQVLANYGKRLVKGCINDRSFQCFDMLMTLSPAAMVAVAMFFINSAVAVVMFLSGHTTVALYALSQMVTSIVGAYLSIFLFGLITTITEWKKIYCKGYKKILYMFTFPIFILTYIPIGVVCIFRSVTWEPIPHTVSKNLEDIRR